MPACCVVEQEHSVLTWLWSGALLAQQWEAMSLFSLQPGLYIVHSLNRQTIFKMCTVFVSAKNNYGMLLNVRANDSRQISGGNMKNNQVDFSFLVTI